MGFNNQNNNSTKIITDSRETNGAKGKAKKKITKETEEYLRDVLGDDDPHLQEFLEIIKKGR